MAEKQQTSRRNFLRSSTAAAIGTGLLTQMNLASAAWVGGDDTIRVGLVGCGGRGSGAARQALSTEGKVKLVAVGDAFRDQVDKSLTQISRSLGDKADRVAVDEDHKFVGFDAYQKVVDSDVDLVILATPPGFRPIHAEAAIRAGRHVFMEKPVAVDGPGVRRVLAAVEEAKNKKLCVGVGLQRHHSNAYREGVQRIQDGAIGDVIAFRCYWNGGGVWDPRASREQVSSEMEYQMRNWYYYNWLCGDHIVEQHIHNLDVCNWIKGGYPERCWGMGGREVRTDKKYGEIFDHFAVEYAYADGTRMFSQCRHIRNCWNSVSEHVHGAKGTADFGTSRNSAEMKTAEGRWRYSGALNDPFQTEHDNLFAAIRRGASDYNEGENGAYSSLTAIMGRMATYSGREVTWEEALNSDINLVPEPCSFDINPPTLPNENGEYPIPVPGVTDAVRRKA